MLTHLQGVIWVPDQLKDFQKYIKKLNAEVGDAAKVKEIIANALVLISTGNNDLGITYFSTPARKSKYNQQTYTEMLVGWHTTFIKVYKQIYIKKNSPIASFLIYIILLVIISYYYFYMITESI